MCHKDNDTHCRFQKAVHGESRCTAVMFAQTQCPYLGKPQPLAQVVETEKKAEAKLVITIEKPPKVDF